jgi:HSP20 family protein
MTLVRFDNRLFNTFFDSSTLARAAAPRRWTPATDLVETDDHFVLRADLPGVKEDDIKVELENNVLAISGERKAEHEEKGEGFYRVERAYGSFARTLALPEGVDADKVEAGFDNGVLEVRVPKPEQTKPKRVEIAVDGQKPAIEQ